LTYFAIFALFTCAIFALHLAPVRFLAVPFLPDTIIGYRVRGMHFISIASNLFVQEDF